MIIRTKDFHLSATVESGQIFRFRLEQDGYRILHAEKEFIVRQAGSRLYVHGIRRRFLEHFFRLDEDHAALQRRIWDPILDPAIRLYNGLRILRQDPWECSIAFLCSQMSNITRIRRNMEFFAREFGTRKNSKFFSFPKQTSFDLKKLGKANLGYRASYISQASGLLNEHLFRTLRTLPYSEAKARLIDVPGIGEKVADCILLYSLEKTEAFPVDVWIKRVMEELYFGGKPTSEKRIREFAQSYWGKDAGYAQQYLFHWRRMLGKEKQMQTNPFTLPTPGRRREMVSEACEVPEENVGERSKHQIGAIRT
ncbi:MAG TPA: DNA glycosylase [Candidatus Nanoarchaeia archaeon]|nr:DNA glycosylase [Candidatus Nanoarchaeia archaeon]